VIRRVVRLALFGAAAGWIVDRWLADRSTGGSPAPIETSVIIDAPIEEVWRVLVDLEAQPRWMRDLKTVRIRGSGKDRLGVGSRADGDVRIFGVQVLDPITITAFEPPRHFGIRHESRFKGSGDIRLDPGVDGTTTIVRWSEVIVPPHLPHLGGWLLAPVLRRVFQADLERLRDVVEIGSPGT
jgi:uncharacterized protein YndB with AHSA1/START domain